MRRLVHDSETGSDLKIRVLDVTKKELAKDLERAVGFDQSATFKKVYENEIGIPGGEPYGLLVADYEFSQHPEDLQILSSMASVAAVTHAPLVAAASPGMFHMDSWSELARPRDLAKIFESAEHTRWRAFRDMDDSRFVALVLPRYLRAHPLRTRAERGRGVRVPRGRRGRARGALHLEQRCLPSRRGRPPLLLYIRLVRPHPGLRERWVGRLPAGLHHVGP